MNRTQAALAKATAALTAFRLHLMDARSASWDEQVPWQYQDMMIFLLDQLPNMNDELEAITEAVTSQVDTDKASRLQAMKESTQALMNR